MRGRGDKLYVEYFEQMESHRNERFNLSIGFLDAMAVIGALQLACRHPGYSGPARSITEGFIHSLNMRIAKLPNTEAIQEVIRRGFDSQYDGE